MAMPPSVPYAESAADDFTDNHVRIHGYPDSKVETLRNGC